MSARDWRQREPGRGGSPGSVPGEGLAVGKVTQVEATRRRRRRRRGDDDLEDRETRKRTAKDGTKNRSLPQEGGESEADGQGVTDEERGQAQAQGQKQAAPASEPAAANERQPAAGAKPEKGDPGHKEAKAATGENAAAKEDAADQAPSGVPANEGAPALRAAETLIGSAKTAATAVVETVFGENEPDPIPALHVDMELPEYERTDLSDKREAWDRMHPDAAEKGLENPYEWENLPEAARKAQEQRFAGYQHYEDRLSMLRERAAAVFEHVTARRDALMAHADSLKSSVDSEVAVYESVIQSAAARNEASLVAEAEIARSEADAATLDAQGKLAAAETSAAAAVHADETASQAETEAAFTQAEARLATLEDAETSAFVGLLFTLSDDINKLADENQTKAKAKGLELGRANDPTEHDGSPFGALNEGRASLEADIKRKIAADQATKAADAAGNATRPVAQQLRQEAAQIAASAVLPLTSPVRDQVAPTKQASKAQLSAGGKSARDQAAAGKRAAHDSLDASRDAAKSEIDGHEQRSQARFSAQAGTLITSVKAAGDTLKADLDEQAVTCADTYAASVAALQTQIDEAATPGAALGLVEQVLTNMDEQAETDLAQLDETCELGIEQLDGHVADQEGSLADAVATDIDEIRAASARMRTQTNVNAGVLTQRIGGIAESFRRDTKRGVAGARERTAGFHAAMEQGAASRRAMLIASVEQAKAQAVAALNGMLARIPADVANKAPEAFEKKKDELPNKAKDLRDAMRGGGTDEGKIHVTLAECSYGEIEALEATYNEMFQERADDGVTPLRYDLADEMGGGELGAAMAFLRHDRKRAIELALDSAQGAFNDEEGNIRALLESCSEEEIHYLNTQGADTIDELRDSLSSCDLDIVNTYLNEDLSREQKLTRVSAIELYEASVGQMGTDEDKIEQLLAAAKTEEQRQKLRAAYNQYAGERDFEVLTGRVDATEKDYLGEMIEAELSGQEQTTVELLAKDERDSTAISASKFLEGGNEGMLEALEGKNYEGGDSYATRHKKLEADLARAKGDDKKALQIELAKMEAARKKAFEANLKELSDDDVTSVEVALLDEFFPNVPPRFAQQIVKEMPAAEEVLRGGASWERGPTRSMLGYLIGMRKLKQGYAEPELELKYACLGSGTKEALVKSALSEGGEPRSKADVAKLRKRYETVWGETLASHNEMERDAKKVSDNPESYSSYEAFDAPEGVLDGELGGQDWLDVRVLLCGEPITALERNYIVWLKTQFQLAGAGDSLGQGMSDTLEHLHAEKERYTAAYEALKDAGLEDEKIEYLEQGYLTKASGERLDPESPEYAGVELTKSQVKALWEKCELHGDALELAAEAFGAFKAMFVNALITACEIIAGILLTVATLGTAAPAVLAIIAANIAIGAAGIATKRALLGDRYDPDQIALDAAVVVGMSLASELKVFSKVGKMRRLAAAGAEGADSAVGRGLAGAVHETGTELAAPGLKLAEREASVIARVESGSVGALAENLEQRAASKLRAEGMQAGADRAETTLATDMAQGAEKKIAAESAEATEKKTAAEIAQAADNKAAGEVEERAAAETAGESAGTAARAAGSGAEAAAAGQKKTLRDVILEELDKAFWSQTVKTAADENSWDGQPWDVFLEFIKTVAIETLKGVVATKLADAIGAGAAATGLEPTTVTSKGMLGSVQAAGGHITGTSIDAFFTALSDPTTDVGAIFYKQLIEGLPKAMGEGFRDSVKEEWKAQNASARKARDLARDYMSDKLPDNRLGAMVDNGELSAEQARFIVNHVTQNWFKYLGDTALIHGAEGLPDNLHALAQKASDTSEARASPAGE